MLADLTLSVALDAWSIILQSALLSNIPYTPYFDFGVAIAIIKLFSIEIIYTELRR